MHKMCIRISTYWHQISIIFASFDGKSFSSQGKIFDHEKLTK